MPATDPIRPTSLALLVPLALLGLGGCMSTTTGPHDPLPVMARSDAQAWARHMTAYMAEAAGITLTDSTADPAFRSCTGRNGETAPDDRFSLSYAVDSTVPLRQHPEAVRRIRRILEGRGFEVRSYREELQGEPSALLDAYEPTGHYLVSAETGGGTDRMLLRISTPCLRPPATPASPAP